MNITAWLYEDSAKRSHVRVEIDSPANEPADGAPAVRHAPEEQFNFELDGKPVAVKLPYGLCIYAADADEETVSTALRRGTTAEEHRGRWVVVQLGDRPIRARLLRPEHSSGEPTDADRRALRVLLDAVAERLPLRHTTFSLHLDSLVLGDFRGFTNITLPFTGPLTVLFGVNGSGKSSVLDAISISLSPYLRAFVPTSTRLRRASELDVRYGAEKAIVEATFRAFDETSQLVSRVEQMAVGESPQPAAAERPAGWVALPRDLRPMPLVVQYPVSRAVLDIPVRIREKHDFVPHSALDGAMALGNKTFRHFFEWFRDREDLENESAVGRAGGYARDVQLEAVRRATTSALPGFSNLRVRRNPLRMTVRKGPLELRIDQLSDGEKCFLALIGDLARRLAIANPWHEDPLTAAAIVLIDEIDLHMHPAWQREVVGILRRTFPGCQFIVTTHSPQVLAAAPNDSVVLLDGFATFSKHGGTYQRDTNAILSEVMGTSDRPQAMADRLRAVNKLLDDEKLAEARASIDQIAKDLGEEDHEVVGLRTALALAEPAAS